MTAILSAILVIVRQTKSIFELELEFDESNPYMKLERIPIKMTKLDRQQQRTLIGGHFVGHLGYRMSAKTRIPT